MRNAALFWRGALAGALGGPLCLLGIAMVQIVKLGYLPYGGGLEILAVPVFLVIGALYGIVIALVLWILALIDVFPPTIVRAIVGASIPFLFVTILNVARGNQSTGLYPPSPMEAFANAIVYCIAFGALPGIAACRKTNDPMASP